tara:strand:- start:2102 stop:2284 length:183 start_codon:yes stop_codon:yes gene_type:complete
MCEKWQLHTALMHLDCYNDDDIANGLLDTENNESVNEIQLQAINNHALFDNIGHIDVLLN